MSRQLQTLTRLLLIAVVAGFVGLATAASAQNRAHVKIPFAFTANHQQVPAGDYKVQLLSERQLALVNPATGAYVTTFMVRTTSAYQPILQSCLVFHAIGQRYWLTQVRFADSGMQSDLAAQPQPERQVARDSLAAPSTIELAMK